MSNEFHNYQGTQKHSGIWEGRPEAVSIDEVRHILKGFFSCGDPRIKKLDEEGNPIEWDRPFDPKDAANEIDTVLDEWEEGQTEILTEERVSQMEQQNIEAHQAFIDTCHPENLTEEYLAEMEENLHYKNAKLWSDYEFYCSRAKSSDKQENDCRKRLKRTHSD